MLKGRLIAIARVFLILLASNFKLCAQVKEYCDAKIDSASIVSSRKLLNDLSIEKFKQEVFVAGGIQIPYRLLTPKENQSKQKFPLVITFHNSSRIGNDNSKQLEYLARIWLRENIYSKYQCYVLAPQFDKRSSIYETGAGGIQISRPSGDVFALLNLIKKN